MNLRDLSYLVALADHRHFGRAAEACFVSQPTLSAQIRKLEDELGVSLFERKPGGVLLTETGARVVERARAVLREVAQIRTLAQQSRDPEAGTLRVGVIPTLAPYLLPHVLGMLRKRFPRLELLLAEEKTENLLDSLTQGRLDAGILALPVPDTGLHTEPLFEEPFVLATPEGDALAGKNDLRIADLSHHQLLLLEEGHCLRDQALEVCHMAGASEHIGFRATSLETLRQMVALGSGITLLPLLAVQPPVAHSDNVHLTPFHGHIPSRRIAMIWRRSSVRHDFLLKVAALFRELPPRLLQCSTIARRTDPSS